MRADYTVLIEAGYGRKRLLDAVLQRKEVVETLADYAEARGARQLADLLREVLRRFGEVTKAVRDGHVIEAVLGPGGRLRDRFREASAMVPLPTETELVYRYDPDTDGKVPLRDMRLALDIVAEHLLSRNPDLADRFAKEDFIEAARARGLANTASLLLWRYFVRKLPMMARWHVTLAGRDASGVRVLLGRRAVAELAGAEPGRPVAVEVSLVPVGGKEVYVSYSVASGGAVARLVAGRFPLANLGDALREVARQAVALAGRVAELGEAMDEAEAVLTLVADYLGRQGFRTEVYKVPEKGKVVLSAEKSASGLPLFVDIVAAPGAGKAEVTLTEAVDAAFVSDAWIRHVSKETGVRVTSGALDLRDRTVATVMYEADAPISYEDVKRALEKLMQARKRLHEMNMVRSSLGEAGRLALLVAHEEAGLDTEKVVGLPPELIREPPFAHARFSGRRGRLSERLLELGILDTDGKNVRVSGSRLSEILASLGVDKEEAIRIERKVAGRLAKRIGTLMRGSREPEPA